ARGAQRDETLLISRAFAGARREGRNASRRPGSRVHELLAAGLLLAGYRRLSHSYRIGRRKRVLERLLERSFLFAFLCSIARLLPVTAFGHGFLGWHVTAPKRCAPADTRPSRPGRCRAIGENRVDAQKTRPAPPVKAQFP